MYFVKSFVVLAAAAVLASATPSVDRRTMRCFLSPNKQQERESLTIPFPNSPQERVLQRQNGNNCQTYLGDCFYNGCEGVFASPSDTIGTCSAGQFNGCPCDKCGSGHGYVGSCAANGCGGVQGTCTAGTFQGCPCN